MKSHSLLTYTFSINCNNKLQLKLQFIVIASEEFVGTLYFLQNLQFIAFICLALCIYEYVIMSLSFYVSDLVKSYIST